MPQVEIPSRYRVPTKGESCIDVEGRTVGECIDAVEAQYPGFRELVVDGKGEVQRFVRLFVNGEQLARDALDTALSADARIAILVAPAGG